MSRIKKKLQEYRETTWDTMASKLESFWISGDIDDPELWLGFWQVEQIEYDEVAVNFAEADMLLEEVDDDWLEIDYEEDDEE